MRIHHLSFQAIGPYPGRQDLDLQQLDEVGLFLLDGPTGAGKSTILDVVTFALYGKADDERKNTELHSTLAEPGTPPTIQLDVSFGDRRFVIDRVLQHYAPRRGAKDADDVVTRQASIALTEIVEGESRQLTTRVDEAQQILRSVIGLSREQFTSVVLLPQGEFARFLKASSNDREAILRQLFNTHRFDEIGDYLSNQAKKLRSAVEADSNQRDRLRDVLIQTAHTFAEDEAEGSAESEADTDVAELGDTALIEHVDATMTRLQDQAQHRVQRASSALDTARERLTEFQDQQMQLREATEYRQRRDVHDKQRAAAHAAQRQLEHHARATPVVEAQGHLESAQQQLQSAVDRWQQHLDAAGDDALVVQWAEDRQVFSAELAEMDSLVEQWKTTETAAIRALEQVEHHEKTQTSITTQQQRLAQWKTTQQQLTQQLEGLDTSLEQTSTQLGEDKTAVEGLAGAEQQLEAAQQQLTDAQEKHAAAKDAEAAQGDTDRAQQSRDTAQQTAEVALEHAQTLLRRRIDAAAGFLAEQLEYGQPCEVCGSTSHPAPAAMDGAAEISNAAVKTAEDEATSARRAANEAEQQYQTRLTALQQLQTRAGGLSVADAAKTVATVEQTVAKAQGDVKQLTTLRARMTEHETRLETLRGQRAETQQQLTEATTQIRTITDELETSQEELGKSLGTFETVEALREAVEPAHHLVGQIVSQGARVATAVSEQTSCGDRVTAALQRSATDEHPAFENAEAARAVLLDDRTPSEHEQLVRQWTTEQDRLEEKAGQTAVLAGLKLLDDGVEEPSDETLETAREAQQAAQAQLSQANRDHGSIQTTQDQSRSYQQQLAEVSQRSAKQLTTYEELVGLSDVVAGRGENAATMPLRSFVLAGWLEQVAANASERLTGMTGGRYELKHAVGQGGRGHAGLNLEVIDYLNDTVRNPSTLSGGETFMASLALALGLADAVQAQAGGVAMDTLFIDEGFGSLDAETLEDVMEVLDALQDDGRLIGLVSHVESMKQQIPYRIQVEKSQTGSKVNVIGPDLV